MTRVFRTLLPALLTIAMLVLLSGTHAVAASTNEKAPDFTLKTSSGKNLRLNDFRGKVVMINFWATWCAPCRKELPYLDALYKKYKKKGFVLLGVNVDSDRAVAKKMAKEFKVSFPVLFDNAQKVSKSYKLKAMPSTFIIGKDGKIKHVHLGYKTGYEKKYEKNIKKLL